MRTRDGHSNSRPWRLLHEGGRSALDDAGEARHTVVSTAIVAQLVEHWIVIPGVAGSSPVIRPTPNADREVGVLLFSTCLCLHLLPLAEQAGGLVCDVERAAFGLLTPPGKHGGTGVWGRLTDAAVREQSNNPYKKKGPL